MSYRSSRKGNRRARKIILIVCLLAILVLIYLVYSYNRHSKEDTGSLKKEESSQANKDTLNTRTVYYEDLIKSSEGLDTFIKDRKAKDISNTKYILDYVSLETIDWQKKALLPVRFDIPMGRTVDDVSLVDDLVKITVLNAPEGCANMAVQEWYVVFVEVDIGSSWPDTKQASFIYKNNKGKCNQPTIEVQKFEE